MAERSAELRPAREAGDLVRQHRDNGARRDVVRVFLRRAVDHRDGPVDVRDLDARARPLVHEGYPVKRRVSRTTLLAGDDNPSTGTSITIVLDPTREIGRASCRERG